MCTYIIYNNAVLSVELLPPYIYTPHILLYIISCNKNSNKKGTFMSLLINCVKNKQLLKCIIIISPENK